MLFFSLSGKKTLPPGRVGNLLSPPWEGGEPTFPHPGRVVNQLFPTLRERELNLI